MNNESTVEEVSELGARYRCICATGPCAALTFDTPREALEHLDTAHKVIVCPGIAVAYWKE